MIRPRQTRRRRASIPPPYVPLWCKSYYSFLEGASSPAELIEAAATLQLDAIAITDRDGVYGVPSAHVAVREHSCRGKLDELDEPNKLDVPNNPSDQATPDPPPLRLIVGSELTLDDDSRLVVLAADRAGYANLCRLVTKGRLRSPKGECRIAWEEVAAHAAGLIALWGGPDSLLVRADSDVDERAALLRAAFGDRLYALVTRHRRTAEPRQEQLLRRRAKRFSLPVAAGIEVLYHARARRQLQDVLTCIRRGTTLAEAGRQLRPNDHHHLQSPAAFAKLFADDLAAVALTCEIAGRCTFSLDQLRYRYPSERLPDGMTSADRLAQLALDGARERFGAAVPDALRERIGRELALIRDLDYDGYFLTMWEIVQFCHTEGIICQGRGSAANSVVCYCLGITAVNPQEVDLLFERFISRERAEPPDIDLDIEHDRREEVIQHVYQKYGRDRAAMVANIVRFRPRSALREVGKVLGLPTVQLDRLAKLTSYRGRFDNESLRAAGFDPTAPLHAHLTRLVTEIQNCPRHLSIHPGGFLLGHQPVHDLVPVENATMPGRTVIQWDKYGVEALGLFKVDLLGLGALSQLHLAFDLLRAHRGIALNLADIPREDPATFAMLCRGDSVGVFQVESRAQMNMLPRLRPNCYYDLVIEVAIVRPGPITGGMVHPYIARRHGTEPVTYPHPSLEPVLKKTLGVPLFQEQVMRLAMVAADYSPGEADQLRRDMATWRRHGPIDRHRDRLITRMTAKGITREFAERVFAQIRGFGEYGFPESHSASFALIAYATAWLKRHHHAEFSCALLNAQPMGFYAPATIVEDARRHKVEVRPVDVTCSVWECTLEEVSGESSVGGGGIPETDPAHHQSIWRERPLAVRMGLRYVKGLGVQEGEALVSARQEQPFQNIIDLARRTSLSRDVLSTLAEAGALAALEPERRRALWTIHGLSRRDRPEQLLLPLPPCDPVPNLAQLGALEQINWDYRTSRHSTRGHPLAPLRTELRSRGLPTARTVNALPDGTLADFAGIVICRQRPGTANDVTFMTLEDETGFVNLVLWSSVFERHRILAKTLSFMGVSGRIQAEQEVVHLIVNRIWKPRLTRRPAGGRSRDFH